MLRIVLPSLVVNGVCWESWLIVMAATVIVERYLRKGKRTHYRLERDWVGILPMNFKLNAWQLKRREIAAEQSLLNQSKRRPWLRWMEQSLVRVVLPESEAY